MRIAPLLALLLLLATPAGAGAIGPGSLDGSFGERGIVFTPLAPSQTSDTSPHAGAIAVRPDGSILVAGGDAVAAYHADGSADTDFGSYGRALIWGVNIQALAVTPDGGAIVAGDAQGRVALTRLGPDGQVVWSRTHQLSQAEDVAPHSVAGAVTIQTDGKVLVGGGLFTTILFTDPFVARFDGADGSLDPTFGDGGVTVVPWQREGLQGSALVTALAGTADDGVVAAGRVGGRIPGSVLLLLDRAGAVTAVPAAEAGLHTFTRVVPAPQSGFFAGGSRTLEGATVARYGATGAVDGAFAVASLPGSMTFRAVRGLVAASGDLGVLYDTTFTASRYAQVAASDGTLRSEVAPTAFRPGKSFVAVDAAAVPGGRMLALTRDETRLAVTRIFSGPAKGRVRVGRRARVVGRRARVKLACSGAPGCVGRARIGTRPGRSFRLAAGDRTTLRLPAPRRKRRTTITVVNPPADAVRKRVVLRR